VTHSGPEVLFKNCVAMKFVDDDDDDDDELAVTVLPGSKSALEGSYQVAAAKCYSAIGTIPCM